MAFLSTMQVHTDEGTAHPFISVPSVTSTSGLPCRNCWHPVTWLLYHRLCYGSFKTHTIVRGNSYLYMQLSLHSSQLTRKRSLCLLCGCASPSISWFCSSIVSIISHLHLALFSELCLNPRSARNGGTHLPSQILEPDQCSPEPVLICYHTQLHIIIGSAHVTYWEYIYLYYPVSTHWAPSAQVTPPPPFYFHLFCLLNEFN